jgi:hypothetical protein
VADFAPSVSADLLIAEMGALNDAAAAVEHQVAANDARKRVRHAYVARAEALSVEDRVILAGMAKIIGEDPGDFAVEPPSADESWERQVTETVAHAWIELSLGRTASAIDLIPRIRARQPDEQRVEGRSGAVNLMAMYFWMTAIEAMARGDRPTARRFWKRALDVGSNFGTDSHLMVSWTYVATFFPTD